MSSLQDVVSFIRSLRTWMDLRTDSNGFVELATRDNGDVGDERAGAADIAEGKRVAKALREKFPDANVEFTTCDEWVSIMVDFAPKRYKTDELEAALRTAFPNIGRVSRMGGTWESAEANVPGIGTVRLVSSMREGGVELDRGNPRGYGPLDGVRLKGLDPSEIKRAVKK
jgi:hypothetical protein